MKTMKWWECYQQMPYIKSDFAQKETLESMLVFHRHRSTVYLRLCRWLGSFVLEIQVWYWAGVHLVAEGRKLADWVAARWFPWATGNWNFLIDQFNRISEIDYICFSLTEASNSTWFCISFVDRDHTTAVLVLTKPLAVTSSMLITKPVYMLVLTSVVSMEKWCRGR